MKNILTFIIGLLIIGCRVPEAETAEDHPLVGVWKATNISIDATADLTAEEYNQYITFINMRDPDTGLDMLGEMRKIILDPEFKAHSKKGEQLDALKRVLAVRKTNAAKMMKSKYKHLAAAIKALDDKIALTGKN